MELILFFVGELTDVHSVLVPHLGSVLSPFTDIGDEQLIETEHVKTGHLRLENYFGPQFIGLLFHGVIEQLWHCFQNPKNLSIKLLQEIGFCDISEFVGVKN